MQHKGTVILSTARLTLRPFEADDAQAMLENWAGDPRVTYYMPWQAHESLADSRRMLDEWLGYYHILHYYRWAIVRESHPQPIGVIAVTRQDERTCLMELGYYIGHLWWGQGIATEALKAVLDFLFTQVGANRIEAHHDVKNPASGAVMRKCGMVYEGTLRQAGYNSGRGIVDMAVYAILKTEYDAAR